MTSFSSGRTAEQAAAEYLDAQGFTIVAQNWRTRYCEIDIVASKKDIIYFVEVKYRRISLQGDGLEYITNKKLTQMGFAAEMWVQNHQWNGNYCLAAIAVAGDNYHVTDYIEL